MNQYEKKAREFLSKTETSFEIKYLGRKPSLWDNSYEHDYYQFTFKRGGKWYTAEYEDSRANTDKNKFAKRECRKWVNPSAYDVLACMEKYEPELDMWNFASEFGYEIKDRESYIRVENIHRAVIAEYMGVMRLWSDVINELREIE